LHGKKNCKIATYMVNGSRIQVPQWW
jgi:hypothetical protein